jgi:TonB family protein
MRVFQQRVILALAVICLFSQCGTACPKKPAAQNAGGSASDTAEALRGLVDELLQLVSRGKGKEAQKFAAGWALPDGDRWFREVFGVEEGSRLAAHSQRRMKDFPKSFLARFPRDLRKANLHIEVRVVDLSAELAELEKVALGAMLSPVVLRHVQIKGVGDWPLRLGYFVHHKGGFRFIDDDVFWALSKARPRRIRIGGNVQSAQPLHRVLPEYPIEAQSRGIQGTVRLEVLIGADGSVKEIKTISGDPVLVDSAIRAVNQWRYRPTLLNGLPVEVVTTIDLVFALPR